MSGDEMCYEEKQSRGFHFYISWSRIDSLIRQKLSRLEGKWGNRTNISFKNASGRGNKGSDPEAGMCLAKWETARRKLWLEQSDQRTNKSFDEVRNWVGKTASWRVLEDTIKSLALTRRGKTSEQRREGLSNMCKDHYDCCVGKRL